MRYDAAYTYVLLTGQNLDDRFWQLNSVFEINKVTENMSAAVFKIEGMTCEGCASIAEQAIRKVPGVLAVEVDYEKRQAAVGTEICCPVPKDEIISALQHVGYGARVSESSKPLLDLSSDAREFKDAFNEAKGQVRIVMLVSPGWYWPGSLIAGVDCGRCLSQASRSTASSTRPSLPRSPSRKR